MSKTANFTTVLGFAAAMLAGAGELARAANFSVAPIQIELEGANETELVAIKNQGEEPIRVQVSAFAWSQSATEPIVLEPTADIAFFPRLLSLAPGRSQNVRIGALTPPGRVEKSYRVFFEELPAPTTAPAGETSMVKVLAKLGVPIFLVPKQGKAKLELQALDFDAAGARLAIKNSGAVHTFVQSVHFTGEDAAGKPVLDKMGNGWYVLPGATQTAVAEVDRGACRRLASMRVEVVAGGAKLSKQFPIAPGACPP